MDHKKGSGKVETMIVLAVLIIVTLVSREKAVGLVAKMIDAAMLKVK